MRYLFLVLSILFAGMGLGQSVLNKKISIAFTNQKTESVLRQIEKVSGVRFAYNAEMFSGSDTHTGSFAETEILTVLEYVLGKNYAYREKGTYIIIKSTREIVAKNEKFIYTISGYIRDSESGAIIPFASIYDSATLKSTFSDETGFYSLAIEQSPEEIRNIGISKESYRDTFIEVKPIDNRQLSVALDKLKDTVTVPLDSGSTSLDKNVLVNALINAKQRLQSINLKKKFTKAWQVSFLPYLGTNGSMSGAIKNRFSINLLGGYAGGLHGVEFGGLFNIDRDTSSGLQFAGIYNLTAGPFSGGQFAGVVNNHFSNFSGGQFAGVANTCSGNFIGFQAAGVMNFARREIKGTQAAGVINYASRVKGAQLSGAINTASEVDGVQIAGLVNTARKVRGSQIGFINIADTVQGLQIGFLSFCRSGVHQVEYAYTDVLQHNITFRTGSRYFYNILSAGYHAYPKEAFSAGYGIGFSIPQGKKANLHLEAVGNALYLGTFNDIPMLARFSIHQELTIFKTISVVFGPDFNFYYTNGLGAPYPNYKDPISYIKPIETFEFNYGRKGVAWVGFHVGVGLN